MKFVKMHGIGNDYVYVDGLAESAAIAGRGPDADLPALARLVSDRHTGVGSDGLILVLPPEPRVRADVRMRMFNADGSEAEMCGNGVRCVAKFAHDRLGVRARPMRVQTGRGVLRIDYTLDRAGKLREATVDMGKPILGLKAIGVLEPELSFKGVPPFWGIDAGPGTEDQWTGAFVSMGNPHLVLFLLENPQIEPGGLDRLDVARIGPMLEHHPAFPRRINVHFVQIAGAARGRQGAMATGMPEKRSGGRPERKSRQKPSRNTSRNVGGPADEAVMRTWERGAGITMACGTGACAVAVAGVRAGFLRRQVRLHLPGGTLGVHWDENSGRVFMTGPAQDVFEGVWTGPVPRQKPGGRA